jgi:PAS domain S-box-containing protein
METKRKRKPRLWAWTGQAVLGGLSLILITFVCFHSGLHLATTAFVYVILIALVSLLGSFSASILLSIAAVACLNYFFAPPLFAFRVDLQEDIVAIVAFVTTSLIVTALVTKLRRTMEATRASEEQWREIFEHNPIMYFMLDPAGTVLSVNASGAAQLGYAVDELIGQSVLKVFYDEDRQLALGNVAACLETPGRARGWRLRKVHKDGTILWVRENAKAVRLPSGQIVVLVACEDITERKQTEDALHRSEMRLAEAQRLSHTGSISYSLQTGDIILSDEMFRIFELDPTIKPTSQLLMERVHPEDHGIVHQAFSRLILARVYMEDRDMVEKAISQLIMAQVPPEERALARQLITERVRRAGPRRSVEDVPPERDEHDHRLLMPDGSIKHVHIINHLVDDPPGELAIVAAALDITAAKQSEEELQRTREELARVSRVTALGELTAAIAHEVSQPLTGLVSSGNACLRWLGEDAVNLEAARRAVERMIRDSGRAAEVIGRIRALVKKSSPRRDALNINDVIADVLSLVRTEIQRNGISLQTEFADDLPLLLGDRIQLQQVILNLVMNASEAIGALSDGPRELEISSTKDASNDLLVTVSDSGPGFDGAKIESIFDAFYTTKSEGMGIGLAVSRSIIEAHGGRLWATTNEPRGAVFRFTLPARGEMAL